MASRALAKTGHTAYAGVRQHEGPQIAEIETFAKQNQVDLRRVLLDITSDASVENAVRSVISASGRIDVLIHKAGRMSYGFAEGFTPEQMAQLFEINVIGTQRLNRAALPYMRRDGAAPKSSRDGGRIWRDFGPLSWCHRQIA